jgi:threonine dehydratase
MSRAVTLADIQSAQERIRPYLNPTVLEPSALSSQVYLKLENTNLTHSFKVRGALNAVLSLTDEEKARGIVTASSGNHAQGVAYAAKLAGVSATIFMPSHTPQRKMNNAKRLGANVNLDNPNYDACETSAIRLSEEEGLTYISPYNDPRVVAGGGTIGLEILDALPEVGRVIVGIGGGGLISGIGCAMKSLKPDVEVIGVSPVSAPAMYNLMYGTNHPEVWQTLAEALSGDIQKGSVTIDMVKAYVDRIVMITEEDIASAIRWMVDMQGWLVEGGGAVGIGVMLNNTVPPDDVPTAVLVSGGNIDGQVLRKILNATA